MPTTLRPGRRPHVAVLSILFAVMATTLDGRQLANDRPQPTGTTQHAAMDRARTT